MKKFDEFRFSGLHARMYSGKYATMSRVSDDESKIVVKVAEGQVFETRYGYGLVLNAENVLWLKGWQVSDNYYGVEVMLMKESFKPSKSSFPRDEFGHDTESLDWNAWLKTAKEQQEAKWIETVVVDEETGETEEQEKTNMVRWAI